MLVFEETGKPEYTEENLLECRTTEITLLPKYCCCHWKGRLCGRHWFTLHCRRRIWTLTRQMSDSVSQANCDKVLLSSWSSSWPSKFPLQSYLYLFLATGAIIQKWFMLELLNLDWFSSAGYCDGIKYSFKTKIVPLESQQRRVRASLAKLPTPLARKLRGLWTCWDFQLIGTLIEYNVFSASV